MIPARLRNIGDALSQLGQAALLPRPDTTSANESISGRSHWEARYVTRHWTWRWAERVIDVLFWFDRDDQGRRHCELADVRDYQRALDKVRRFEARKGHGQ